MNEPVQVFVLPGLDGTSLLLDRFWERAPDGFQIEILELREPAADYPELCERLSNTIVASGDCILIAESFSGPLGILLAARHPDVVRHLFLVATFARRPISWLAKFVPWSLLFRLPIPGFAARRMMLGRTADQSLIAKLRKAVSLNSPKTLAARVRMQTRVDVTDELKQLTCPITYIRPLNDALIPMRCANEIAGLNSNVDLRSIGGPHLIMQTQPERIWEIVSASVRLTSNE